MDSKGYNCTQYAEYNWCTSTGGYGEGWKPHEPLIFEDFAKDGETGIVCPECGCKGDKLSSTGYFYRINLIAFLQPEFFINTIVVSVSLSISDELKRADVKILQILKI